MSPNYIYLIIKIQIQIYQKGFLIVVLLLLIINF